MAGKKVGDVYVNLELNVAKISKQIEQTNKQLEGFASKIEKSFKFIGTVAGLYGLSKACQELVGKVTELAEKGQRAQGITENFERLGGSSVQLQKASDAILGIVSSTDLMRVANQGLMRGIPGFIENFDKIANLGAQVAESTGGSTVEGIEKVTQAIASGNPKLLARVGILVNGTRAVNDWATAHDKAGQKLDKFQIKAAILEASIKGLGTASERYATVADSVTHAHEAYEATFSNLIDQVGKVINQNPRMIEGWRAMQSAIKDIDAKQFAEDIGSIASKFLNLAADILPIVVKNLNLVALGIETISHLGNATETAAALQHQKELDATTKAGAAIRSLRELPVAQGGEALVPTIEQYKEAKQAVEQLESAVSTGNVKIASANEILEVSKSHLQDWSALLGDSLKKSDENSGKSIAQIRAEEAAAKKAAEKLQHLREEWDKANLAIKENSIKDSLETAIGTLDQNSFEGLLQELSTTTEKGMQEGFQKYIDAKIITEQEANAAIEAEKYKQELGYMEKMEQALASRHADSTKDWMSFLGDAITGSGDNIQEANKKIAAGIGGEILATLTNDSAIHSFQDIGQVIGRRFVDELKNTSAGQAVSSWVSKNFYPQTGSVGANGTEYPSSNPADYSQWGMAAPDSSGVIMALAAALTAKDKPGATDNMAAGAGIGMAVGAVIGSLLPVIGTYLGAFVGSIIGGFLGSAFKSGGQQAETVDRRNFGAKFNQEQDQKGKLYYYDTEGVARPMGNLQTDPRNQFDTGKTKWVEEMQGWGDKAMGTFTALGEALKQVYGLTEDVGSQMGYIIGKQIGGSVDAARLAVYQLGYSLDDLQKKLLESALKGDIRWAEYLVDVRALNDSFGAGLEKVGAFNDAFNNLMNSGGRGKTATKALRDVAVEGIEAGIKNFDELKDKLIAEGQDPGLVDAMITAIKGRGIESLDQLSKASDEDLGAVVGDMEAASKSLKDTWTKMGEDIDALNEKLKSLPEEIKSKIDVELNLPAKWDEFIKWEEGGGGTSQPGTTNTSGTDSGEPPTKSALGNVFTSPGMSIFGEDGPEAILPLKRINGRLGVSMDGFGPSGFNLYIDARNATPGAEARILSAMQGVERRAVSRTLKIVNDEMKRGRF